jgi:opacity protein-like surface antigen
MRLRLAAAVSSLALAFPALASEHYQPVRVELVLVGAYGPGDVATYGGGLAVEPKYNVNDQIALGLRIEATGMASENVYASPGVSTSLSARGVVAFLAKADVYLTTTSARPFLGFGAGLYTMGSATSGVSGVGSGAFRGFGIAPQVGLNIGHFRIAATYNVVTGGQQVIVATGTGPTLAKDYFAFEIGGTIGGSRTDEK